MQEKFLITGMTCSACSSGIERALSKVEGVQSVSVSLMAESMCIEYNESVLTSKEISRLVIGLGYGISPYQENVMPKNTKRASGLKKRFFISLLFLIPLMYFSMGGMVSFPQPSLKISTFIQALLTIAIIVINFKFFIVGTKALLKRVPNMDTLVAMGAGISFLYSFISTILLYVGKTSTNLHVFYESAAMILTLVTLGKWLEEKSKRKTGEEIEKLIQLIPSTVHVEVDGKEEKMPFATLKKGDVLIVRQGEYIPVDGVVLQGHAFIDRSAITGESMPIEVKDGDKVTGADIVKSGFIKVLAEKVGGETSLSQIIKMVKDAGASKAPLQKMADKIAGIFVPMVTLISIVTLTIWWWYSKDLSLAANYAISVLVISCPCSLGLATPVAVMAATGKGMSLGILYKDAETLQKTKDVNCVLLDKTATLTVGRLFVTDFQVFQGEEITNLQIAASIERHSNHPIAVCIRDFVERKSVVGEILVENYVYQIGKGAKASYQEKNYYLGNRLLKGVEQKKAYEIEKNYAKEGKTAVFLSTDEHLLAVFAVADSLKEESHEAVSALKNKGVRVGMLTGDNENVASAIAKQVGIDDYFAEALPSDKVEAVRRVRQVGGFVAMVGDGINDSPALKEADVGIAMGNGTDVAIDTADIVLSRDDIRLVGVAIELSQKTVRTIKQNLFWAFFYNMIAIPVAAGVFAFAGITLNPMIGAACMCLSSLFVVTNALRLTRFANKSSKKTVLEENNMKKTLKIEGMMCPRCVAHVTKALQGVEGVAEVDVNLKKKTAVLTFEKVVENELLINAVTEAGYEVKKID